MKLTPHQHPPSSKRRSTWLNFLSWTRQPPPLLTWKLTLSFFRRAVCCRAFWQRVAMVVETYLIMRNCLQSPHRSQSFYSQPNPLTSPLANNPPPQQLQCSSFVSSPLSWLSVSSIIPTRFNPWSLTSLIVLAAASAFAGPIPADSLSKKEVAVNNNILAREPDSELEILAREPEDVEAREPSPICPARGCL